MSSPPSYSILHSPPPSYSPSPPPKPLHINIDPNIPSNYPHLYTAAYNGIRDRNPISNIDLRFQDAMLILVGSEEPECTVPGPTQVVELGFEPNGPATDFTSADVPSTIPSTNAITSHPAGAVPLAPQDPVSPRQAGLYYVLRDTPALRTAQFKELQDTVTLMGDMKAWLEARGWDGEVTRRMEGTTVFVSYTRGVVGAELRDEEEEAEVEKEEDDETNDESDSEDDDDDDDDEMDSHHDYEVDSEPEETKEETALINKYRMEQESIR